MASDNLCTLMMMMENTHRALGVSLVGCGLLWARVALFYHFIINIGRKSICFHIIQYDLCFAALGIMLDSVNVTNYGSRVNIFDDDVWGRLC